MLSTDRLSYNVALSTDHFVLRTSSGLEGWLYEQDISLAFSTYQTGKLFFVGLDARKTSLSVYERNLKSCMGLSYNADTESILAITLYQIWRLNNIVEQGSAYQGHNKIYVPQGSFTTGKVSGHDISWCNGQPVFVNTLFNCLATVSETHSFKVLWKPDFISDIAPEDRCHLNGLAVRDGVPFAATAVSRSNEKNGWRKERQDGGVVIDINSNRILAENLSMPHSPRFYRDRLWLLNSGKGEFGYLEKDQFVPVTCCPGYLRGLSFKGDYAIVGLSLSRDNSAFQDLELDDRLPALGGERCGLQIIDIRTGEIVHVLVIEGVVKELYDVMTIPGAICPMLIGFETNEIERMISIQI